jgi:thymidine phosphorylase
MCSTCACAEAPARPAGSGDEVSAALERLTAHAGNAKKFRKVAELATQLLQDGQLARKHGKAVFQVRFRSKRRFRSARQRF